MTPSEISERKPIFIIGTGRSGTSLLRTMMCAHPRIYLCHEASFWVWESMFPRKKSGEEFLDYYFRSFSFRWLQLHPREVLDQLQFPFERSRRRELFTAVMRAKAARYDRPRWGDKTPSHAGNLKKIFEDYPEAKVIRIVRDPRAVVKSLTQMPWASESLLTSSAFCELEHKQVQGYRDRLLEIRLEDLLKDTRGVMGQVLDYVEEPWHDHVLDHSNHLADPDDMPPVPWFQTAAGKRSQSTTRWQDWPPEQIRLVEYLNRGCMEQMGYSFVELKPEQGGFSVARERLKQLPEALRFLFHFLRIGLYSRDPANLDKDKPREIFKLLNRPYWVENPDFVMPRTPQLPEGWRDDLQKRLKG